MHALKTSKRTPKSEEQRSFVCYVQEFKTVETRQWNSHEKAVLPGAPIGDDILSVDMSITQAPPSFRKPVTQKKACTPPFKIQISVRFGKDCVQLPVKVNAYALSTDSLASFLKHVSQGSVAPLPSDGGLANASIYKCLENRQLDTDNAGTVVQETFEFVDMHFKSSSRMALRWLLFVARVRDDILCTIYKHPTIVLSRKTDQYCKACSILEKNIPMFGGITDGSSSSQTRPQSSSSCNKDALGSPQQVPIHTDLKEWMLVAYNECHFRRSLTQQDLGYLGMKLEIRDPAFRSMLGTWTLSDSDEDRQRFDNFAKWYLRCLSALKKEETLWCSDDVMRICPFVVDRSVCERLLEQESVGTFLLRISSEPGSFVLSVKEITYHGECIEHFLIDALDLRRRNLSSWIMANKSAQLFLDVASGVKFPKHCIFAETSFSPSHFMSSIDSGNGVVFDSPTGSDSSSFPLNQKYTHFVV